MGVLSSRIGDGSGFSASESVTNGFRCASSKPGRTQLKAEALPHAPNWVSSHTLLALTGAFSQLIQKVPALFLGEGGPGCDLEACPEAAAAKQAFIDPAVLDAGRWAWKEQLFGRRLIQDMSCLIERDDSVMLKVRGNPAHWKR